MLPLSMAAGRREPLGPITPFWQKHLLRMWPIPVPMPIPGSDPACSPALATDDRAACVHEALRRTCYRDPEITVSSAYLGTE